MLVLSLNANEHLLIIKISKSTLPIDDSIRVMFVNLTTLETHEYEYEKTSTSEVRKT